MFYVRLWSWPERAAWRGSLMAMADRSSFQVCVRGALIRVVRELSDGNAVAVVAVHAELTTQEAAALLNVSRPYVIGLLDAEKLPCTRAIGGHRRVRLTDVLA